MITQQEAQLRQRVAKALKAAEVSDETWDGLVEERIVQDALDGGDSSKEFKYLVKRVREGEYARIGKMVSLGLINVGGDSVMVRAKGQQSVTARNHDPRLVVLARLVAAEAAKHPHIRDFRRLELGDRLMAPTAVEQWIKQHVARDEEETKSVSSWTIHAPWEADLPGYGTTHVAWGREDLFFSVPGDIRPHYVFIRVRESHNPGMPLRTLESLRELSKEMASYYGWFDYQATTFILTGDPPPIESITNRLRQAGGFSLPAEIRLPARRRAGRPISAMSRIALSIDPTMTPEEVAEYYRWLRRLAVNGKHHRPLQEKAIRLAEFPLDRPPGETIKERMKAWNEAHPQWRYEQITNFGRDCVQARERLMYPDFMKW